MAYSADTFVADEQPTTAKWNKLWSNDASFNDGTGIGAVLGSQHFLTGVPVQIVHETFSAVSTGTTVIPRDDTIPQNTEGNEYMTASITPKSATNILFIQAFVMVANGSANNMIAALFQDSTAGALAAVESDPYAATAIVNIPVIHKMVAGTTSATTFKIRAGGSLAGTTTFNGSGGARFFGAIPKSSMIITEYKAS